MSKETIFFRCFSCHLIYPYALEKGNYGRVQQHLLKKNKGRESQKMRGKDRKWKRGEREENKEGIKIRKKPIITISQMFARYIFYHYKKIISSFRDCNLIFLFDYL